jgi:RHS repeat-associated protein
VLPRVSIDPSPYRDPVFSLRRPSQSILSRFLAHLLVRLLIVAPFPAHLQAAAALFPVSMLWPLVAPEERAEATSSACILKNRVRGFDQENVPLVGSEGPQAAESHQGYELLYGGIASDRLLYARSRYYDPRWGRFIQRDTWEGRIDEPPSLNAFVFGYANPLRYVDPMGHMPEDTQTCKACRPDDPEWLRQELVARENAVKEKPVLRQNLWVPIGQQL